MKRTFTLFAMLAALLLWAQISKAQYIKLFDFTGSSGLYPGWAPQYGNLLSDDTYLYGMTSNGGTGGIGNIFKIKIAEGSFTDLHDFNGSEGGNPCGSLVSDGTYLYGMASTGGAYNNGTVFKIKIDDNSLTTIHEFNGIDGASPFGSLIFEDGYLYGMTERGGTFSSGTAFNIKIADNSYTKIHDFNDTEGGYPRGSLISDGAFLYGMTLTGGINHCGSIFKIKIAEGSFTVMHNFNLTDGGSPLGSLISDGTYLYGMASAGGLNNYGTIFKIKIDDNSFTKLHDFSGITGISADNSLVSDGTYLYGMSVFGGVNQKGNIFKLKIADNSITTLHEFNGTDGATPEGSLIIQGDGLYGMTTYGGAGNGQGGGVVFKYQYTDIYPDENNILYVDSSAAAGGDGSSWATAVTDLADALHYARTYAAAWAGDSLRIYVAKGTYLPKYRADDSTLAASDENDAFVMVKNVQLLGGFPSGGGGVRNWAANPTVLSGDIGTANEASDNAYHVVVSAGDIGNALLDGFTITGGNATGTGTVTVNGQTAQVIAGGGIYTIASDLHLTHLKVSGNIAQSGGGMYNNASDFHMTSVSISGNTASTTGGGMRLFNCYFPILLNVTISGNKANIGGGVANVGSNIRAYNSILFANSAATGKNIYNAASQGNVYHYCLIEGSNGWEQNWGTNAENCIVTPNNPFADSASGNYQLVISSPAIDAGRNGFYSLFTGNLSNIKDLSGNARIYNQSSGGVIDMGAYEFQGEPIRPDVNGVMYVDSSATIGGDGSSWATAIPQLSDALKAAEEINNSNDSTVKQIWIAKGTYYPLYYPEYTPAAGMTDRDKTFMLVNKVLLFGGFKGTETSIDDRSVLTGGGTILSGDINERGNNADNVYHVLTGVGEIVDNTIPNAIFGISDVTITGGNAADVTSSVQIKGRTVYRNEGGGLDCRYGVAVLLNCLFYKNSAVNGGAILTAHSVGLNWIINCTFSDNADSDGKAFYNFDDAPLMVRNSIVMDGIRNVGLQPDVAYSLIQGMAASSANHILDGNTNPQFIDPASGNYRLAANSPAINEGDNSLITSSIDLDNYPRVYDQTNGGIIDLGAYEFQGAATLPVKMGPLSGALGKDNQVLLTWHTYLEINNKGFQIEYGTDGAHFENGLFEPSKAVGGNSTAPLDYTVNAGVLTGIKYYRLKQLDLNGDISYSNTIRIAGSNTGFSLKAYPIPTHDLINIHLDGVVSSPKGQVNIMDLAGRVLKRQDIRGVDSKIDLSGLAAGVYILKYADGVHQSTIKIIKK